MIEHLKMEELSLYFFIILVVWMVAHYLYKVRSVNFIKTFLDSQNTMMFLSTENKVKIVNKMGLKTLGFTSLNSFLSETTTLLNFFIEEDGCLHKHTYGKKWLEILEQSKEKIAKVKIFSKKDKLYYYYQIKVSKLKGTSEYILIFTDISDMERTQNNLRECAENDPLTKIYNRTKVNYLFESIFVNAKKYNQSFSVILFDIDHFKMINDTHGHNVGDKVLFELARLTQSQFRSSDILARWGGEEFIIILKDTTGKQASMLANRVRVAIDKYNFTGVGKLTCSFGVTQYQLDETKIELLERVDEALYEAKDGGRNRVVIK